MNRVRSLHGSSHRRPLALVRGGGDLATGVALRLFRAGFGVLITEVDRPTVVRRTVAFAEAVYEGVVEVEGLRAVRVHGLEDALRTIEKGEVPIVVDPEASIRYDLPPALLVDAIMAKRNLGTCIDHAPAVVALGPGFVAGKDAHAVIETMRGHTLGRVITEGAALPNTGIPGEREGFSTERVLRAPCSGLFVSQARIGDWVVAGQCVGAVAGVPVTTEVPGLLRGLLRSGLGVREGFKMGDVDPAGSLEQCFRVSDKALAIAGGVLEAACGLLGLGTVFGAAVDSRATGGARTVSCA